MDRLWTPWRLSYVTTAGAPRPFCVFCDVLERGDEPLVAWMGERAFIILNKFPYNNGHLMIVPKRHVARLTELDPAELLEIMTLSQAAEQALSAVYAPHGFNLGMNLGRSAGAGIADHLHVHIVPRWDGDTSFMTVFGDTRVLPEELPVTAGRIREALARILSR
ncbi:MAG: HIT domain-containing protein [Acidobacteria bacterium]|nr:HIT domain-containing protein [Acidobacteriota bacterium]